MNYIPMGFAYDHYVTQEQYDQTTQASREQLLLKGLLLNKDQIEKWSDMLDPLTIDDIYYSKEQYAADCAARSEIVCSAFEYTNSGFSATITTPRDVPVFFSIPYEKGWTAYVNGQKTDIAQANVGFMAVRVNAGENIKIRFVYRTPGLLTGAGLTVLCLLLLTLYMLCARVLNRYNRKVTLIRHNMVRRSLQYYAAKHKVSFDEHPLIRLKSPIQPDRALEKKEGFTDE